MKIKIPDNKELEGIAKQFGTPTYVYFADSIKKQAVVVQGMLPEKFSLFYAVKANPHPEIIKLLLSQGLGMELASGGELRTALACGTPPKRIIFAGPGKTDSELEDAIHAGIKCIHIESCSEFKRINDISAKFGKITTAAIRVNPKYSPKTKLKMGGKSRQFGIDEEQLTEERLLELKKLKNINLIGIHIYAASGINRQKEFLENVEGIFKTAEKLSKFMQMNYVNIGGGIGISYSEKDPVFETTGLKEKLGKLVAKYNLAHAEIAFEPGRFLVGPGGILLVSVVDTKTSRGTDYAILDGGLNVLLRPALIRTNHPCFNLSKRRAGKTVLAGPLCTPLDILGSTSTEAEIGDIIAICQTGAHCLSASMPLFLSHGTAAEVLVDNEDARLISKRLGGNELASLLWAKQP